MKYPTCAQRLCFGVSLVVLAVVGFPTFFLGCQRDLQPHCYWFNSVDAVAVSYMFFARTCRGACLDKQRVCSSSDNCHTSCARYATFGCYDGYVEMNYAAHGKNHSCRLKTATGSASLSYAQSRAERLYPIGRHSQLLVDTTLGTCFTEEQAASMTIVGVVCFVVGGVLAMAWGMWELVACCQSRCKREPDPDRELSAVV
jgi:hypothetical protein